MPQLTFVLDVSVEVAMSRLSGGLDRLESRGVDYMHLVRQGFLTQACRLADTAMIVDASQSADQVHAQIIRALQQRFGELLAARDTGSADTL